MFPIIEEMSAKYPITLLCKIAGVSRSGYYKWLHNKNVLTPRKAENEVLKEKILECYSKVKGTYGYRRVQAWLGKKYGFRVNKKRVHRLMRELGIQAKIRQKKRYFGQKEVYVISDNHLNREFTAQRPNEKWVTDITYLQNNGHRLYLSAIKDLFDGEIIAYTIGERNDLQLVLATVKQAVKGKRKKDVKGVLLHSDQGFQYTSRQYNKLLTEYKIKASMSRKGNCLDNASMESFFSHLKAECLYVNTFESPEEMAEAVRNYITFYNEERIQLKLNGCSPREFRATAA
ncbi:IS3 family transposase [Brevibacillus sp. SAFN-007a]|uniref:IS3 family transposase n=1 Tax=Brevibacillus sp. SAFN-007a TaxID=3436862 RepID=UPI003F7E2200